MLKQDVFLCNLDDLDEQEAIELSIDQRPLFAVRQDDNLYAYWNNCPHVGVPLNWIPGKFLDLDKTFIQCSSHGAIFGIDTGKCVAGPCLGDHLSRVALKQKDNNFYVAADQQLPNPPINLRAQALADLEDN
ncbi:MAG: nitrite reductase/ring-hydroxylating ferredoxin subunit [Porticoccaceae bacterium]|jgi:nitrite reductase/ring-hydroxylating ferredoxin subunit